MRVVVFGAGAVGSVIGGRLTQHAEAHGHDVTLVARGAHLEAMRARGLTLNDPSGSITLDVATAERIDQIGLDPGDAVLLTMKTQDSAPALAELAASAPDDIAVVCVQNGVENERLALRHFRRVYGVCVMLPATMLEPGVVDAAGAPHNAILDIGRYPAGVDPLATELASAFEASGLASRPEAEIMRAKYAKLLMNLRNVLDALVVEGDDDGLLYQRARQEAEQCLAAAGIGYTSAEEDRARRHGVMRVSTIPGRERGGGSTWQSLVRGAESTEVDWLNGEIVLLGRLTGTPTPVNAMLRAAIREALRDRWPPRSVPVAVLESRLG